MCITRGGLSAEREKKGGQKSAEAIVKHVDHAEGQNGTSATGAANTMRANKQERTVEKPEACTEGWPNRVIKIKVWPVLSFHVLPLLPRRR